MDMSPMDRQRIRIRGIIFVLEGIVALIAAGVIYWLFADDPIMPTTFLVVACIGMAIIGLGFIVAGWRNLKKANELMDLD